MTPESPAIKAVLHAAENVKLSIAPIAQIVDACETQDVSIQDALRVFYAIRLAKDALEAEYKRLASQFERLSGVVVPERMRTEEISTMTLDDLGYRFTVSNRTYASMADKENGKTWLRDNGYGDIIQETVNAGTLGSLAKELLESQGIDLPAEFFNVTLKPTVSMTKVKGKG